MEPDQIAMMDADQLREELREALQENMNKATAEYLIGRLQSFVALIKDESYNMAIVKLLADISALRGIVERKPTETGDLLELAIQKQAKPHE